MAKKTHTDLNARDNAARITAKAKAMHEKQLEEGAIPQQEEKSLITFKELTFRQKLNHLWYYYKWHAAGAVFAVICAISLIYTVFIKVEPDVWCGVAIYGENLPFEKTDLLEEELADKFALDTKLEEVLVTNYYEDSADVMVAADLNQKFNTYIYAGYINLIVSTADATETFIEAEYVEPLSSYLSAEQIKSLDDKGMIYYADDPYSGTVQPMAIVTDNSALLKKYGIFEDENAYFEFVPMAENIENTVDVLYSFLE